MILHQRLQLETVGHKTLLLMDTLLSLTWMFMPARLHACGHESDVPDHRIIPRKQIFPDILAPFPCLICEEASRSCEAIENFLSKEDFSF